MAVHLNRSLPTRSSLAFFDRNFHKAPAPPRLLCVRSQKLTSDSGDPLLSIASSFAPKKSVNLDRPEASVGSSGSSSLSSSAIDFLTLCHRLKTTKRKGWINQGIKGPESIADHMYRMALMALIAGDLHGANRERCIKIAIVHDIAEAIVGDITPSDGIPKEEKSRREQAALKEMCEVLGGGIRAEEIKELWEEYENNSSLEANLVKDFDKVLEMRRGSWIEKNILLPYYLLPLARYTMLLDFEKVELILQALEYEMEHGKVLDEFFLSVEGKFQTEIGKSWAAEITSRRDSWWGNKSK